MYFKSVLLVTLSLCLNKVLPGKILVVVPTPSVSHQVVFRPLTQELAKRGHEVVYITTDPVFTKDNAPENLTEIDVHDISYNEWKKFVLNSDTTSGTSKDLMNQVVNVFTTLIDVFEKQIKSDGVQKLLKSNTKFDLIIIEAFAKPALVFSHLFKAPVILMSSFGSIRNVYDIVGAPVYPKLLYPVCINQRVYNLTLWDKVKTLYDLYWMENYLHNLEEREYGSIKKMFGENTPNFRELEKNVAMLFLNIYPLWELNRPVPPSVVHIGGIHQNPLKGMPQELKSYLDTSQNGVVYVSFGTNVNPSQLPEEKISILVKVFSQLPYDVLWKCDINFTELPKNLKIMKWVPQPDLLRHPNIKLFITQGGLQSTDEAITSGVPLVGVPMLGDQWFNVEQYVRHGIGVAVQMETLEEGVLKKAIETVINDGSYRQNVAHLRNLLYDQLQSPLERAVWWTEHVLRHGGAAHLRAPAANLSWPEYLDVELLLVLILVPLSLIISLIYLTVVVISKFRKVERKTQFKKE